MKNKEFKQLILTALFAAIIFIGTYLFRIEIAPKVMVHLGNALVVVTFFILGTKSAMIAASVGFGIFDLLSGYANSVVFTVLESLIVVAVLGICYRQLHQKDTLTNVTLLSFIAGLTKIIVIFTRKYITNAFIIGNGTTFIATLIGMTNTFITSTITAIIAPILYFSMKKYIVPLMKK
ncbi:ECF transporter S component [Carnobacteriaceae bacterium zg-ZUI78]|nr:ECF transporter S component [Carnobacteriaceae bacterium zg-ZUI78]